jgi:hypothetical protein
VVPVLLSLMVLVSLVPESAAGATAPAATAPAESATVAPGFSCASEVTAADATGPSRVVLSASSEGVRATLTAAAASRYGVAIVEHPVVAISGGPADPYRGTVVLRSTATPALASVATAASGDLAPICITRFAHQHAPTVLVGFNTAGAHCCTIVRAYSDTDGHWTPVDHEIGDPGVSLGDLSGSPVLVSADDSFSYRFADYADSADPVQIFTVSDGHFIDVTRSYRGTVAADAATWWANAQHAGGDDLGLLAAWVADECTLGHQASAYATLAQLERQGRLSGPSAAARTATQPWPSGATYLKALKTFLVARRYCAP